MDKLTPSQWKVVNKPYEPASTVKVIAGPGSGKTLTLLHKVHHLVTVENIKPDEILIFSLTNKAVDNIIENLLSVFEDLHTNKEIIRQIGCYTIHGLANRIVVENEGMINIIEEIGWRGLMKLLPPSKRSPHHFRSYKELEKVIKDYKLNGSRTGNVKAKNDSIVIEQLVELMDNCKVMTNDDLIIRAKKYLELDQPILGDASSSFTQDLQNKYKVVLIDEFQDLYPSLAPLVATICKGKQLIMFGDTNQSIYEFLGNNKQIMWQLDNLHPKSSTTVLKLFDNFRSTPEIISLASRVINLPPAKKQVLDNTDETPSELVRKLPSGVLPQSASFDDLTTETEFIIDKITQLICSSAKFSDIAILSRTNSHLTTLGNVLKKYGIPFEKLKSQPDWMDDLRIQFLLDIMKVCSLASDEKHSREFDTSAKWQSDFSILVTMSAIKGVGDASIQALYKACGLKKLSIWKYLTVVPNFEWPLGLSIKKKIENYTANLYELIEDDQIHQLEDPLELLEKISNITHNLNLNPTYFQSVSDYQSSLEFKTHLREMAQVMKVSQSNKPSGTSFIKWFLETYFDQTMVFHQAKQELKTNGPGTVKLSTIHSAKGLEFPIVFLTNGIMSNFPMDTNSLYVGMTRARNLLYMSNMKHQNLISKTPLYSRSIMFNESFWTYYNKDLNRSLHGVTMAHDYNIQHYNRLRKDFGFYRAYSSLRCCKNIFRRI
ncbi:ATP-dependent 3'-5' DNA helicase [Saccharomyces eubayanus]|uniref:ATP-dependent 3'-5' DNA helicase n=1 Tax=Saccharomyces eubayanus TaxID=1080349 RepID=UPI0006C2B6FE|nr:HMI1-like protein [Saccharomyces eubayanus]KOG98980.1 HMI1-like protein [Saccharomyces eubayanus]